MLNLARRPSALPRSYFYVALLQFLLSSAALVLAISDGCNRCGGDATTHAAIALLGCCGYALLLLLNQRGASRLLRCGIVCAAFIHALLAGVMMGSGHICPVCIAVFLVAAGWALDLARRSLRPRAALAGLLACSLLFETFGAHLGTPLQPPASILADVPLEPAANKPATESAPAAERKTLALVVYENPDCPHCHEFHRVTEPQLRREFGDRVTLEYRPASSAPWVRRTPTVVLGGAAIIEGEQFSRIAPHIHKLLDDGNTAPTFGAMQSGAEVTASPETPAAPLVADSTANAAGQAAARQLPGTPVPANTWTMVQTSGFPESIVGYDNLVYAPAVKKFITWNNYHNITSETNEGMLAYDFNQNRWDLLALNGNFHTEDLPESGHEVGLMQYDSKANVLLNYCCESGSQGYDMVHHTWLFDPLGLTGRDLHPPTMPGLTSVASAVYDSTDDVFVLFQQGIGTWIYNLNTNTWTNAKPSGTLPATGGTFSGMTYDSANNTIYLFGGITGTGTTNDLFSYSVPSNTWTKLSPSGTLPSARVYPGFAYDSTDNVILMFSGQTGAAGGDGILNDTWIYDPTVNAWTQLSPAASPPVATMPSYQRLAYDPDDNVFALVWAGSGGYANGQNVAYGAQTWLFRYKGTGPNAGTQALTYAPTPGSLNRNSDAWADEPVLAASGSTLYASWSETGRPFDTGNSTYPHIYASAFSNSAWTPLGLSYLALDSEFSGYDEAHAPALTVANGTPCISWYKTNNSGNLLPNSLYAKFWNGSSWSGGAVGVGNTSTSSLVVANRSQLTSAGTSTYLAFLETDRSCYPWCTNVYVKKSTGSGWSQMGTGPLNRNAVTVSSVPIADSIAITSDGVNPIVAWTEYTRATSFQANAPGQVYCSKWNGSAWTALGAALNVNAANWADNASIAYLNGQPYVAWTERTQTGMPQVYVKTWNGSAWSQVGSGSLNRSASGWAFRPNLSAGASSNSLLLAWVEQPAIGTTAQLYVDQYASGTWNALGGSLNADAVHGSAERANVVMYGTHPVAAWGEVKLGSLRQIYAKQWNGTAWTALASGPTDTQPPSVPANVTAAAVSSSQITLTWSPSTDNVGVTGYVVYRNGSPVATVATTSYSDPNLSAGTLYSYTIAAFDAAGNTSAPSASASATTPTGGFVVPGTYVTSHPRLPHPDDAYLTSLAANASEFAKYSNAATNWNSTNPSANLGQFRRLLIAYLANKAAGNTTAASTTLAKIEQLADLGGTWGPLLYAVNDGLGNGTYTLTSASANFLTGCNGGSCAGNILSLQGYRYTISQVTDAHTIVLSKSNPAPSGSSLQVRIFSDYQAYVGLRIAMIYDWLYNDLSPAARSAFLHQLDIQASLWEADYTGIGASPYNDVFYVRDGPDGIIAALAIYPDFDTQDPSGGSCPTKPCGTYHLHWTMDKLLNVYVPVWHQVFGQNGGGWHEDWSGYVNSGPGVGLTRWLVPALLSWQSASGQPFFAQNPWLKNFATWTMYTTRPDFTMEHIGEVSAGTLTPEYIISYDLGAGAGSLNGLAEIYNDPVLRGWARLVNQDFAAGPSGFEPSAWPFYTPDTKAKPVSSRAALPTTKNFDGWGTLFMRSGWGESDTDISLRYGDNFWSHTHADAGAFTISHRGNLAISSSTYRSGSNSKHEIMYGRHAISQNTLLIVDPNDVYPAEQFGSIIDEHGSSISLPLVNDGGQRRAGTFYNQLFPEFVSPDSLSDWQKHYDDYHMGTLAAWQATPDYTYAAIDITAAYNNKFSAAAPNSSHRTQRASSVIRNLVFIPPGYVIVYDEVNSTNPAFKKKWLLHSINAPVITGNRFEIRRTENVTESLDWTTPYASQLKFATGSGATERYQYDGKLIGWMIQPAGTISAIGGPGKEFWVEDPKNPGTGTNWNQCMQGQCSGPFWGFLAGSTPDLLSPNPNSGPIEPGSWRIEESPSVAMNQDYFLNVMLATNAEDTNVPATVTSISTATSLGATWSDNTSTYTITFPKNGIGGHLTITGSKSIDSELGSTSTAPLIVTQPADTTVAAGQSATFTVSANGAPPLTYQWNRNGAVIDGATSAVYVTPPVSAADNGAIFSVVVSNASGSVTSNIAVLSVTAAPVAPIITAQPSNATVPAGATATFSVGVAGTAPFAYQWMKNGTAIEGAADASYTTPPVVAADDGASFHVKVTNSAGSIISDGATLKVTVNGPMPQTLTVSHLHGTLTAAGDHDSATIQGLLPNVASPFNPAGQTLVLKVGSAATSFTLNASGRGKTLNGAVMLKLKRIKGQKLFQGGTIQFSAKLQNVSWQSLGIDSTAPATNVAVSVPVAAELNGITYSATIVVKYSTEPNGKGRFSK